MKINILQVGVNDGKDHVLEFVKRNQESIDHLILVDANPECLIEAEKTYSFFKKKRLLPLAISVNGEEFIELLIPKDNAHSSVSLDHLHKHGHTEYSVIKTPAKSLNNLLDSFDFEIDRLYIDTEGLDIDIINSLDLSKYRIPYLVFEYIHSDGPLSWGGPKLDSALRRLSEMGYEWQKEEYNIVATLTT